MSTCFSCCHLSVLACLAIVELVLIVALVSSNEAFIYISEQCLSNTLSIQINIVLFIDILFLFIFCMLVIPFDACRNFQFPSVLVVCLQKQTIHGEH